jgi:hypothetical protein
MTFPDSPEQEAHRRTIVARLTREMNEYFENNKRRALVGESANTSQAEPTAEEEQRMLLGYNSHDTTD